MSFIVIFFSVSHRVHSHLHGPFLHGVLYMCFSSTLVSSTNEIEVLVHKMSKFGFHSSHFCGKIISLISGDSYILKLAPCSYSTLKQTTPNIWFLD